MTTTITSSTAKYLISVSGGSFINVGTRGGLAGGGAVHGVEIAGFNNVLFNTGTILGPAFGGGAVDVVGSIGNSVTNQLGGVIHSATAAAGIYFAGGAPGTVTNAGKIFSDGGTGGDGIVFNNGGTVTNLSTGTVSGGGIYIHGAAGTVINSGIILGDPQYGAVEMFNGGQITNLSGGTIAANGASYGVFIKGGAGTVTNAGTITGGSTSAHAVILTTGFANRVIVNPGAVFIGDVNGGNAATSTLELASSASTGTLSGFGTSFTNFGTIAVDASANWLIKAAASNVTSTVFTGLHIGDTLDLAGFVAVSETFAGNKLVLTSASNAHTTLSISGTFATSGFSVASDGAGGTNLVVICFGAGTMIDTPSGEVLVEKLVAGDMVSTAHNGPRAVAWIGKGKVLSTRGKRTAATPVIVRKGALADNVPNRDLHVTKAHSLYIDCVLIPVEFLVNHRTIVWDDRAQEVEIYHVELDSHDVLIANGTPAESYRDDGNRWLFQNANSGWGLPPQEPFAPVLTGGPVVDAIWARLLNRAGPRDLPPMTDDADVHLVVDGVRVDVGESIGQVKIFHLSPGCASVRIASREVVPAELGIARDSRTLGVALRRIAVRQGTKFKVVLAQDARLANGFHSYEPANNLRWTNGDAAIPAEILEAFKDGEVDIVLTLAGATMYPDFGAGLVTAAA